FQTGTCIDKSTLGRLATSTIQRQIILENVEEKTNDIDTQNNQQDPEIELFVNNIVCTFALGCKLNLRKIAMEAANVIYKRGNAMLLMKMRNPYCSANLWSSGKVTVTGTTSEVDAQRAARRVARCLQRLGFNTKFRNYRIVNCLATCSMPWTIDIVKLSRLYPECVSYEPEIHPGATVRLNNRAVLKVFTTGSVTLTELNLIENNDLKFILAPSVDVINTAVNDFYPQLFECRKNNRNNNEQRPTISNLNNNNNFQTGTCIDKSTLGRLATSTIQRQIILENVEEKTNDIDTQNNQQDPEIELFVNNIVCTFALGCKLNLRKIAMEAANVIYKRGNAMVLMKMRNPYCSANLWSSGKVTVTGTTSEDDAQRAARRVARCLQRLGFNTKFRNYRIVNCLATCSMPWTIDIVKLSRLYPECVSYEPEIHPGATVRLNNRAVLKVFTTGSVTLTAPSVDVINTAVNDFYPQLFECRKNNRNNNEQQLNLIENNDLKFILAPSVDVINTAVNDFYPQLFECRKNNRNNNEQRQ
ncbi:unnamed protein product, partial [Adineta steineri]